MKESKTILIVEDESIVAFDLKNRLENMGYIVPSVFHSGEVFLNKFMEFKPDLVLMDINLKGELDGIDTAIQYKKQLNAPVIFLTAFTDKKTIEKAKYAEPFGYLIKPCKQKELETNIELALYKHQLDTQVLESRKWFVTLLNSINDAVMAVSPNLKVSFANTKTQELLGIESETVIGKRISSLFHVNNADFSKKMSSILNGESENESINSCILKIYGSDEPHYLEISLSVIANHDQIEGCILVFKDISEKIESEKKIQDQLIALETNEKKYRNLFEGNLAGVCQVDQNGKFISCNKAFAQIFGFSSFEEISKYNASDFYFDNKARLDIVKKVKKDKRILNLEQRMITKNGSPVWILENVSYSKNGEDDIFEATIFDITNRKMVEQELSLYQNNLITVLENTDDIIFSFNTMKQIVVFNTPFLDSIYNSPEFKLTDKKAKKVSQWEKYINKAFEGQVIKKEISHFHNNQLQIHQVSFNPIYSDEIISGVSVFTHDITEKKLNEIEKLKNLNLLNTLFEQSEDAFFVVNKKENKILDFNQRALNLFGFETKIEISESIASRVLIPKNYRKVIYNSIKNNQNWEGEIEFITEKVHFWGSVFMKHIKVAKEELIFIRVTDISKKKQTELELLLFQSAIAQSLDSVVITIPSLNNSFNTQKIIFANSAFSKLSGYENLEVLNKNISILNGNSTSKNELNSLKTLLKKGKKAECILLNYRKNKEQFWCEWKVTPILDTENNITNWVYILRDLTEKKILEEKIIQQKLDQQHLVLKTIVDTQELERKRFAEDLHEGLGQTLSGLKLAINSLNVTTDLDNKLNMYNNLNILGIANSTLDEAISKVRTISYGLMPGALEDLGIDVAINDLCKTLTLNHKIKFNFKSYGIKNRYNKSIEIGIYRALQELINNILKHSHATEVQIQLIKESQKITFIVEDNGVGFSLENINFDHGIGLKNVENRIKLLKGNLLIASEPEKGCNINIEIPV